MKKLGLVIALVAIALCGYAPRAAHADFIFSVRVAPPPLPVYDQPEIPGPGYLWTPGYWSYDEEVDDYYWVPGVWVEAPEPGLLWTPGYWGYHDGVYGFSEGYWGPTVGFYGGVSYGFGYTGVGFFGGRWQGTSFYYNRSVTNVNVTIIRNNVYNQTVNINRTNVTNVSFNGGTGGLTARPTPAENEAAQKRRLGPTTGQTQHTQLARKLPDSHVSQNRGSPNVAAVKTPGGFTGPGVVKASAAGSPVTRKRTDEGTSNPARRNAVSTGNAANQSKGDAERRSDGKAKSRDTASANNGRKTDSKIKTNSSAANADRSRAANLNERSKSGKPPSGNPKLAARTTNATRQPVHHPNGPPKTVAKRPAPKKKTDEKHG